MLIEHAKPEYRLCVQRYGHTARYGKRDLAHAQKGLDETIAHWDKLSHTPPDAEVWIETRSVTEWKPI